MTEKQLQQRREAARRGGLAVFRKYGREYMSELGKKGAKAFHAKYNVMPVAISGWAIIGRKDNIITSFF